MLQGERVFVLLVLVLVAQSVFAGSQGRIESVSYRVTYDNKRYEKTAYVYVPASYDGEKVMPVLYLLHGSSGSAMQLAEAMAPLLDDWTARGEIASSLVVFPTYYPDRSFVTRDYRQDYPLNRFFVQEEIEVLIKVVEGTYHTFARGTDAGALMTSRLHRAFGGYSMGGVTTWEVLAAKPEYFAYFLPMAGDCWRQGDVANLLAEGLRNKGLGADDFRVIAMVGEKDGTKYQMQRQVTALWEQQGDLFTKDNLLYWENEDGGHDQISLEVETRHAMPSLWSL